MPDSSQKSVLITGATGFIGSHLAERLHAMGYGLRALVRKSSNTKPIAHLPIELVPGNFDDPETMKDAVSGVDYVYHVAGVIAAKRESDFFRGNNDATHNLLTAVERYNPGLSRFVHVSSLAAVGPAPDEDHPVDETTQYHPITAYGRSKAAAENEAFSFSDRLPITIVRPPAVYGPRDTGVYTFFQTMQKGFAPIIGFGRKVVSLVHVEDLVHGFIEAAESPRAIGEAYFISSERFYTWEHVGQITAKIFGKSRPRYLRVPHAFVYASGGISGFIGKFRKKPPIFDYEKARDITQPFWICSVKKAQEHFGYHEEVTLEDGIARTVAWYKENGWL